MAILMEVGEVVAAPPAGKRYLRLDDNGAAVIVAPDGTEAEIGGSPPANSVNTAAIQDLAVTTGKIAVDAVTNAVLANMAAHTVKGNATAGSANPTDLTQTELTAEINACTTLLPGAMSIADKSFQPKFHTTLTDATVAIAPSTLLVGAARLPAATLTANRELTLQTTGAASADTFFVAVQDRTAFSYTIRNGAGGSLVVHGPNATSGRVYMFFFNAGQWILSQTWYSN